MKVTLDSLTRYGDALNSIANEASAVFSRTMNAYISEMTEMYGDLSSWSWEQRHQLRDYASDLMVDLWNAYGDASSSVGSMFFEDVLGDNMPDKAVMTDHVSRERAEKSARYWAGSLFGDDADIESFVNGCSSFLRRQVSHSADMQVLDGADELASKKKRIKYARVPTGPSCGFCIMLASRGFVYASKESAGEVAGFNRFHENCNCRIVAGYEGLQVEGYDYEGMYRRYKQCRKAIGDTDQLLEEWNALTPEERDQYGRGMRAVPLSEDPAEDARLRKKLGAQADGFNDYVAHRIAQEMDSRDREWLYSGESSGMRAVRELWNQPLEAAGFKPDGRGSKRNAAHSDNWQPASLNEAIARFAPNAKNITITESGKIILEADNHKTEVLVDRFGGYFTIQLRGGGKSKRRNLDIEGNIVDPDVNIKAKIYEPLVHFSIGELDEGVIS